MRYFLIFILSVVFLFAGGERKIILSSYKKEDAALRYLNSQLSPRFSKKFISALEDANCEIKVRQSGNLFIIVAEPIKNYKIANTIKSLLPQPFNKTAFINAYTKPKQSVTIKIDSDNELKSASVTTNSKQEPEKKSINIEAKKSQEDAKENIDNEVKKEIEEDTKEKVKEKTLEEVKVQVDKNIEPKIKQEATIKKDLKSEINITIMQNEIKEAEGLVQISINPNLSKNIAEGKTGQAQPVVTIEETDNNKNETWYKNDNFLEKYEEYKITKLIEDAKRGLSEFGTKLNKTLMDNLLDISIAMFIFSLILFAIAVNITRKYKKRLGKISSDLRTKSKYAESLQIEVNHLKTRHINFINSLSGSVEYLQNKFIRETTKDIDTQKAVNSLTQILASHKELGEVVGLDESEFNLNLLVSHVIKAELLRCEEDVKIINDFDLFMLRKVVGDRQKVAKIFKLILEFTRLNTHYGRILVFLNQTIQDVDGKALISVVIRSGINGFSEAAIKNISRAFDNIGIVDVSRLPKQAYSLKVAKRLLEIMGGSIEFIGQRGQECNFVFSFKLKIINKYALQESLFAKQHGISLDIVIFGNNKKIIEHTENDLRLISIEPKTYTSWSKLTEQIKDIYVCIDLVIVCNRAINNMDFDFLLKKAKQKNFAILVIVEEDEAENQNLISYVANEKSLPKSKSTIIKVVKKPYNKKDFIKILKSIDSELIPFDLSYSDEGG